MILVLCISPYLHAQVGIGTTTPKSSLDIKASSQSTPNNTDGILIPRFDAFPATNPGADQDGMLAFLNTAIGTDDKGFYYWDNDQTKWINIGAEEWKAGTNPSGDNLIYATRAKLTGTDMVITDDGRIGFGTDDPVERFEFRGPGDNDFQITSANTNPPNYILYNTGGTLDTPGPLAANGEIGSFIVKTHDGNGIVEPGGFRFYMDGVAKAGSAPSRFVISTTPDGSISQRERIIVRSTGNVGLTEQNPTATLHIRAGAASAGSAPIKLTTGTNLTTPEKGAIEYDGTDLYFTPNTTRKLLLKGLKNTASLDFPNIPAGSSVELTITVTGATVGSSCSGSPNTSLEPGLMWSCYVSAANTVKIRLSNITGAAINPALKSWKVTVIE
ncbi:MAG TPA: hypothetical protein DEG69_03490 [Flavobacteriaceae bacterium]|nr:hypothetical protein [Flavobacteriaceae bacterium]